MAVLDAVRRVMKLVMSYIPRPQVSATQAFV